MARAAAAGLMLLTWSLVVELLVLGAGAGFLAGLLGMSASTLRYQPRADGNGRLRERL